MADRYEKSFTRKSPAYEPAQPAPQEDPLAELARIVSGNQSFDDLVGRPAAAPRPAARPIPTRSSPRDLSFDLESELLNDLQSSFDPASRAAPQRAEPPVQQPRSAQPTASREPAEPPRPRAEPRAASWTSPRDSMEDDPYAGTAYASSDPERDRGPAPDPLAASRVFGRSRAVPPPEEEAVAYEDEGYYDDGSEPPYDDGEYGEERFTEYARWRSRARCRRAVGRPRR
ncbi:MAG: hypothetical protein J0H54_11260 [Rhizobiales bacterium]|nr:hypothetical protein [Hyphomicrobiales bacterium]